VVWTGLIWLWIGTGGRALFEHGTEPSGTINCWEIFEQLSDWRLHKKG
jgi:hypothetical protein